MSDPQNNIISEEMMLKLKVILEKQHDREFEVEAVREIAYGLVELYKLIAKIRTK